MDLPKLFVRIWKKLFVVYFFVDKYSTLLEEFSGFPFSETTVEISTYKEIDENLEKFLA